MWYGKHLSLLSPSIYAISLFRWSHSLSFPPISCINDDKIRYGTFNINCFFSSAIPASYFFMAAIMVFSSASCGSCDNSSSFMTARSKLFITFPLEFFGPRWRWYSTTEYHAPAIITLIISSNVIWVSPLENSLSNASSQ